MNEAILILGLVSVGSAIAAMSLRNVVHCLLWLVVSFVGLAGLYLALSATFVGFTQVLVYLGAVAILIVFAILLTRSGEVSNDSIVAPGWGWGVGIAVAVFAVIGWAVLNSAALPVEAAEAPDVTVRQIGIDLMTRYVVPLEVIGLLLTAALIGAVGIAPRDREGGQ